MNEKNGAVKWNTHRKCGVWTVNTVIMSYYAIYLPELDYSCSSLLSNSNSNNNNHDDDRQSRERRRRRWLL